MTKLMKTVLVWMLECVLTIMSTIITPDSDSVIILWSCVVFKTINSISIKTARRRILNLMGEI